MLNLIVCLIINKKIYMAACLRKKYYICKLLNRTKLNHK